MAGGPAETLMGVSVLGFGVLLAYSAYKDVPVFGPTGMLTEALKQGKLQPVRPGSGPGGTPPPSTGGVQGGGGTGPPPRRNWIPA